MLTPFVPYFTMHSSFNVLCFQSSRHFIWFNFHLQQQREHAPVPHSYRPNARLIDCRIWCACVKYVMPGSKDSKRITLTSFASINALHSLRHTVWTKVWVSIERPLYFHKQHWVLLLRLLLVLLLLWLLLLLLLLLLALFIIQVWWKLRKKAIQETWLVLWPPNILSIHETIENNYYNTLL